MGQYLSEREENIVGKGENAGYQHFLLFPQCFQKDFFILKGVENRQYILKELKAIRAKIKGFSV